MFRIALVTCIAAISFGSTLKPIGLRKLQLNPLFPDGRIVGGVETDITEVPYQVALEALSTQFCGGSLVSETHVVTAAHCLELPQRIIMVRVGSSMIEQGGTLIKSQRTLSHPQYNRRKIDYDVGIVELLEKAPLSDKVKPIPVSDVEAPVNSKFRVSGWGATEEGGLDSERLLSVYIPVISREKCGEMYVNLNEITSRMICTHEIGKDSCQGDSGGPAAMDGKLYGIVSWGIGCARPDYAGVYTNVGDKEIRDFIRKEAKV